MNLEDWQREVHKTAVEHGWWDPKPNIREQLLLVHSEVAEATEALRQRSEAEFPKGIFPFAEELADIVIRVMDLAEGWGINLEAAIMAKNEYNKKRPYRHGDKQF